MKKLATAAASATVFALTILPALAQGNDPYGLNYGTQSVLGTKELRAGIMQIINQLLTFLGVIAICIVLWGGFRWMTAGGEEEKVEEAKKIITSGVIGLVIIFASYMIVNFVITGLSSATTGV